MSLGEKMGAQVQGEPGLHTAVGQRQPLSPTFPVSNSNCKNGSLHISEFIIKEVFPLF